MSVTLMMAAAGADEAAKGGFPPFESWHYPSQLFWLALCFAVLYFALSRNILPKLSANIERRNDQIANDLDEAARLNDKAQEAEQALELSLAKAKSNARKTIDEAQAEVAAEIAEETRRVDAQIDEQLEAADIRISELRAKAMANVQAVADTATDAILAKLNVSAAAADRAKAVKAALGEEA